MLNTTYLGREITRRDNVKVEGTFQSFYEASKRLMGMGYIMGSMCGDEPIGFADADKYEYIAKWRNIDPSDRVKVDGVMISSDWREGSVEIIWFKEPLNKAVAGIN